MFDEYNKNARQYFDRYESMVPHRLYEFCRTFFYPGASSIDIGCGSGRDVAWLQENNFPAVGLEPAVELLRLARAKRPDLNLKEGSLPGLVEVADESHSNLLSSGVLMHLPSEDLLSALFNILRVLKSKGRAILSFRNQAGDPRQFHSIEIERIQFLLEGLGAKILLLDRSEDTIRPEVQWVTLVVEKSSSGKVEGLKRLQSIIQEDKKTATYKLALVRALCAIARYEAGKYVAWKSEDVLIPASRVAHYWARYYYGLLKAGLKQNSGKAPAFSKELSAYKTEAELVRALECAHEKKDVQKALRKISQVVLNMPVKHIGGAGPYGLFQKVPAKESNEFYFQLGMIRVPAHIWRDISLYGHWVEDSLILEWARMTARLNKKELKPFEKCLALLNQDLEVQRDTIFARNTLAQQLGSSHLPCVWTGKKVNLKDSHLDHLLPFAYWQSNDLWNLLPASPKINLRKSAKIPSVDLLQKSKERIFFYWDAYQKAVPEIFQHQRERALYLDVINSENWKQNSFDGLCFLAERGVKVYGLEKFDGVG